MQTSDSDKPLLLRIQIFLAKARFFTFSALVHFIIVIVVGSAVIFVKSQPPTDFTAGDGDLISYSEQQAPPEAPTDPQPSEFQPVSPAVAVSNLDAISTTATSQAFSINAVSMPKVDARMTDMTSAAQGLAGKIASSAGKGGTMGGTATRFGSKDSLIGLAGTFYDTKQTKDKKSTNITNEEFQEVMRRFVREGWKEATLDKYFKAPRPLYTTQFLIPNMAADNGPKAFEMDKAVQPSRWLVHYQGRVSPPRSGKFRFVGAGDDYLVIKFNGKMVFDHGYFKATDWQADKYYDYGWTGVPRGLGRSEEIRVEAGQFYDMEVLIAEQPGSLVFFVLFIEESDQEYQKDGKGNPILPVFRLANMEYPPLQEGQTLPPYAQEGPLWKSATSRSMGSGGSSFDQFFNK